MTLQKRYAKRKLDPAIVTLLTRMRSEIGPGQYLYVFAYGGRRFNIHYHKHGYISLNVSELDPGILREMLSVIDNDNKR